MASRGSEPEKGSSRSSYAVENKPQMGLPLLFCASAVLIGGVWLNKDGALFAPSLSDCSSSLYCLGLLFCAAVVLRFVFSTRRQTAYLDEDDCGKLIDHIDRFGFFEAVNNSLQKSDGGGIIHAAAIFESNVEETDLLALMKAMSSQSRRMRSIVKEDANGKPYWREVEVEWEKHVFIDTFPAEQGDDDSEQHRKLDDIIAKSMREELPYSRPLWKVRLFRDFCGGSVVLLQVSHTVGDGLGLSALFLRALSCASLCEVRDVSLPAPRPEPVVSGVTKVSAALRAVLKILNGTNPAVADPLTPLKRQRRGSSEDRDRFFVHLPSVPVASFKREAQRHPGATVNDVLVAAVTQAYAQYLWETERGTDTQTETQRQTGTDAGVDARGGRVARRVLRGLCIASLRPRGQDVEFDEEELEQEGEVEQREGQDQYQQPQQLHEQQPQKQQQQRRRRRLRTVRSPMANAFSYGIFEYPLHLARTSVTPSSSSSSSLLFSASATSSADSSGVANPTTLSFSTCPSSPSSSSSLPPTLLRHIQAQFSRMKLSLEPLWIRELCQFVYSSLGLTATELLIRRQCSVVSSILSNLPGPTSAVSLGSAKLSVLLNSVTLPADVSHLISAQSYDGKIVLSVTGLRAAVQDPQRLAACLHRELQRL